jgi:hypothetical protein
MKPDVLYLKPIKLQEIIYNKRLSRDLSEMATSSEAMIQ